MSLASCTVTVFPVCLAQAAVACLTAAVSASPDVAIMTERRCGPLDDCFGAEESKPPDDEQPVTVSRTAAAHAAAAAPSDRELGMRDLLTCEGVRGSGR